MPNTDKFNWPIPTIGGSGGTWGAELNELFNEHIEETLQGVKDTADAALPRAGGEMTGTLTVQSVQGGTVDVGTVSAGSREFDTSSGDYFIIEPTGAQIVTFTGFEDGKVKIIAIEVHNGAGRMNWPSAVKWDSNTAPTFQQTGVDIVTLVSHDGGVTILGVHSYTRDDS